MQMRLSLLIGAAVLLMSATATFAEEASTIQLRQLEKEIETLKEGVLKEKLKVRQLEEAVLYGKIHGTYAYITFKNEAQDHFNLIDGEFFLNGQSIRKVTGADLEKNGKTVLLVMEGEIAPGDNTVSLQLRFRGKKQGPFAYVEEYAFNVDSKKQVNIETGKTRAVEIVVSDRGFGKSEYKDRLAVSFNITSGS